MSPSVPPGAADDVAELFRRYRETGDRSVRNEIVERHRHLADGVARRYRSRGVAVDDLRQTALLAMVRAAERFDPTKGASFATFAGHTMEGELKRALRDRSWTVRPPRAAQERYLEVRQWEETLTHRLGRAPTVPELAEAMGVDVDAVLDAVEAAGARTSVPLTRPDDDGAPVPLEVPFGEVDPGYGAVDLSLLVDDLLAGLDERSRTIVRLRFYERLGQDEIAAQVGVSQSYLSRMIRRILAELRADLDADGDAEGATRP